MKTADIQKAKLAATLFIRRAEAVLAVPVARDTSPQIYRRKKVLTPWEMGEREARMVGAGRWNF
ncbi:MAG TPA: hypothetical protein DCZ63_06075 [Geobacter sp.]|nr:hypothetical protein [Geobacter sp.]